jgi:hypothetical protein
MSGLHSLQISPGAPGSALTPEQKRFNTLLRQIEQARRTLAAWRDNVPLYLQAHTQRIVPLLAALTAARGERAFAFDRLLDHPGWSRAESALLRELICDSVAEILEAADEDDAALKALFDKHADVDLDTERQTSRLALKDMMEAMTGLDLGDDADISSDQDLFERMRNRLAAETAEAAEPAAGQKRARRKTAARQRREAETQLATQSIREIFRKLASALHPDREVDPAQRKAKTALMQRVNQAYAANDLLTLLELQLQIEQVDASHVASASAQRLKQYNKLLAEQLAELKAEAARLETTFRMDFGLGPGWGLNPTKLTALLRQNTEELRSALAMIQLDLRMLADRAGARRWLKRERQRQRNGIFDDEFF